MATVLDRNSKADTRFLCDRGGGGAPELATDISQWRTNLTNNTTYLTSSDARLAPRSPREISVVIWISTADSRIILNWGQGTSYMYRIQVQTGGTGAVQFGHNGATLLTLAPPGVGATAKQYLIHWSTDYDSKDATYYSEMAIGNIAANTWAVARIAHTQPQAVAGGDQFNLRGVGAGSTLYTGGLAAYDFVRIGCRFHSTTEASEDWVVENPAPSITGISPTVELAPSSTSFYSADPAEDIANSILDEGTFAGPIEYSGNINATAQRRRLYSPILNIVTNSPPAYSDDYFPDNMWRQVASTGSYAGLHFALGHVYWRPTTYRGTRARVRVQAQAYLEAGAPGGSTVSAFLCMFSQGAKPGKKVPAMKEGTSSSIVHLTTNDTDVGVGTWYDLGVLPLASKDGGTWLALGVGYGTGTGHDFIRLKIKAITVEPFESE